jgi:hypothetical protein
VVIASPFPIVFCGFPLPCWAMDRPYCKTVMIDRINWSIVLKLPSLLRGVRAGCVIISEKFDFRLSSTQEKDLTQQRTGLFTTTVSSRSYVVFTYGIV